MIDCHCHLSDNSFKEDVDQVIDRSVQAGVEKFIVVPEFPDQAEKVIDLSERWKGRVYPSIGVHPIQKRNKSVQMKHFTQIEPLLHKYRGKLACIGEIGLDLSPKYKLSDEQKAIQIEVFKMQLHLAKEFNLPVNVHSRCASFSTLSILSSYSLPSLLHAFDGTEEEIHSAIQMGSHLSISPAFTTSKQGELLASLTPLSQLLLESDSPALGMEKGRNEPSSIIHCANFISKVKGIPADQIVTSTTENAKRLFSL
ncbi:hypothetical protein PFISCL1PPCAC_6065 [Pristionchus fissidentatus]|uniref:Uncharacterized protein n=1 Tax=Pristionchus fissidentatus TaxID=1538716 RepID=A0AAV5V931_9BILA|nr:hypothetical protein PFISCL1PPCAC_6065 [Pristionchus fissidentatus]